MAALKLLLFAALAGYLALAALVWFSQERLMFYPVPPPARPTPPAGWLLEEVAFDAADGSRLAGVLVRPPAGRAPLVIYYGGNAEEVTGYASTAATAYGERAVLLVNYRGYGHSTGKPGEKALVADALQVFDWAARRGDIDTSRIAVHGRSLGSGVAVQVAAARPVRCVLLTSPFTSAVDVARLIYPWLPVNLLMRHRFDSAAHAPRLSVPALVVAGAQDDLVPASLSARLAARWGGPVEQVAIPAAGHNDLSLHPRYDAAVRAFLDRSL